MDPTKPVTAEDASANKKPKINDDGVGTEGGKSSINSRDEPYPGHDETLVKYLDRANEIHSEYPLLDGHNDLPWALRTCFDTRWSNLDLTKNHTGVDVDGCPWRCLHTDIPRLRQGGVGAQLWSVYVPTVDSKSEPLKPGDAIALTLEQIDIIHQMCELYPDDFALVEKADEIEPVFREGKIASLMGVEGGHQIGGSLRAMRMFQ